MKPTRQVECVELMVSANNITIAYVRALLAATPANMMVGQAKQIKGINPEQLARMEKEMSNLQGQYKMAEESYATDMLNLVLAKGYLSKLLMNAEVLRYLGQSHPDLLPEFKAIAEIASADFLAG